MNRKVLQTCAAFLTTVLGLLAGAAEAQSPPTTVNGDWPNLGAYNNRQGQNADPTTYTSGVNDLRWRTQGTFSQQVGLFLDNTSFTDTSGFVGGPYDPPGYGQVATPIGTWPGVFTLTDEAFDPFLVPRRTAPITVTDPFSGAVTTYPVDYTDRLPAYNYATLTPSARGTDPRVPLFPADLKIWEWAFTPPATGGGVQNYAIYTWLPTGGTVIGSTRTFPQRYYVYEILYGNGQSFVDVVDTAITGGGYVRLGGNSGNNSIVFPWDNANPIRVRLYNTVPRSSGILALDGARATLTDNQERILAAKSIVYADACEARPQNGSFLASPTAATWTPGTFTTLDWQVTVAKNAFIAGPIDGSFSQQTSGLVTSYEANPLLWPVATVPAEKWNYSVVGESANATNVDDTAATFAGGWTTQTTGAHIGATHRDILASASETATGTYAPILADGSYAIYVYVPGTAAFAQAATYRIYNGTTVVDTVTLDQSAQAGWARLGSRYYTHDSTGNTLHVEISDFDGLASDQGARRVFADAMRFVSPTSIGVTSTPVHATVNIRQSDGTLVATKVVIVADDSGKIHCLDMRGKGDGTTTEYWSYPTTVPEGVLNYADPNLTEGIDGTINPNVTPVSANLPTARMPNGFDLSTAAVATVGTQDLLYIASTNGRVYCIDMAGRGDFDATTRKIGTTSRQWTYPNDYDPSNPTGALGTTTLGSFRGSIVFGDPSGNGTRPTVYVPARQGRVYALSAVGNPAQLAQRRTGVRWAFPTLRATTLPEIVMTPTLAFGNLYFGTARDARNDGPGQFFAIDATSGAQVWRFDGTAGGSDVTQFVDPTNPGDGRVAVGAFITGPVAVSGAELDKNRFSTLAHPDTVYALNQNVYLYGFNAQTGAIVTNGTTNSDGTPRRYETNEFNSLPFGNLSYTVTREYNLTGGLGDFPVIVITGQDGILRRAFARLEDGNLFEGLSAGFNLNLGSNLTSAASANNTMFTANAEGVLFAFDAIGDNGGNLLYSGLAGGQQGIPPNDPRGRPFRSLKIRLLKRAGWLALRTRNADNEGSLTYGDVDGGGYDRPPIPNGQTQYAFEWGETAYVLVYNFPFATTNTAGQTIAPPQVNVTLAIDGKVSRTRGIYAQRFKNGTGGTVDDGAGGTIATDGYAIYPFTFQGGGAMSLPPGNGVISATVSTAALGTTTTATEISQDPRRTSPSRVPFIMANPLALIVESTVGSTDVHGIATATYGGSFTGTTNSYDLANRVNGSPDLASTSTEIESQLLASAGFAQHGSSVTARAYVVDRSLMALIRPEGRGIENLRVSRSNLALQGGVNGLYRLLDPGLYPNFEDLPGDEYPNNSLDYPDIGRERVAAVSNPETEPDNPLLQPVNLLPPLDVVTGGYLTEDNQDDGRLPRRTPLNLVIDVPLYQPPINVFDPNKLGPAVGDESSNLANLRHNSAGTILPQGYFGRVTAFVDSTGDGKLTVDSREPYRAFNLSVGVLPQVSILAGTPNVDLGSLAAGTGYSPADPSAGDLFYGQFSPWANPNTSWSGEYKPFSIRNEGNVNLLQLRFAKGGNNPTGAYTQAENQPWQIVPSDNDPNAWMSGANVDGNGVLQPGSLWSNIDSTFATPNPHTTNADPRYRAVILPKARVTDRIGPELVADPYPRANPNTGANGLPSSALNTNLYGPTTPKVGVSVPIGFPVGNYTSRLRVFEDQADFDRNGPRGYYDQVLNYFPDLQTSEAYSDPITLSFRVRETRMTNSTTPRTAPVIDPNLLPTNTNTLTSIYRNTAPAAMRDGDGVQTGKGDVTVVWPSNRPNVSPSNATDNPPQRGNRLFFAQMVSTATKASDPAPQYNPPLWDLSRFDQTGGSWLVKSGSFTTGYPTNPGALFKATGANETVDDNFTSFDSPAFPVAGTLNPFDAASTLPKMIAFVGTAEVATETGRVTRSRVFVTTLSGRGASLAPAGAPTPTLDDPLTAKGKPSLVEVDGGAFVFYPVTSAGQTGINVSRYTTKFDAPVPLDFGGGFTSVASPSASARYFQNDVNAPILDFSFAGKLRGRPNAEVYLGRMNLSRADKTQIVDAQGNAIGAQGAGNAFSLLPQQARERLVGEGGGLFRARGVAWSRSTGVALEQTLNGSLVNLLVGNPTVDRQSGFIVYDSRLGGKVYLDPNLGTVRFAGASPSVNAEIRLSYTPSFLRVTPGGAAAYSSVNALFDGRYVSERDYWFTGNAINSFGNVPAATALRNDRYFFAYGRGASGSGVTARPYTTTMRLGLRLPTRVATNADGSVVSVSVTGNALPYQVDAANGRIYFQAGDEGKTVQVTYTGVNEATNATLNEPTISGAVSYVLEREETPVLVDEATNESALTAFLDPFTYANVPRPPLVWLFYVSTRGGSPDVYFQTIAPRLTPFAK